MIVLWAWIVEVIGPWVMVSLFALAALAFGIGVAAMVEATRRQPTFAERAIGVFLVLVLLVLGVLCGAVAWLWLSGILGR